MAKTPSLPIALFLVLALFHLCISQTLANDDGDAPLSLNADFPTREAQKLIRGLNLFPKEALIVGGSELGRERRVVERRFEFPGVVDSAVSVEELGHHAGYYKLRHSNDARMFYFFFESRNSQKDPVVIWLTGGPGCSSELAIFYENGPFTIAKNMSLLWNEYGWDKPTGTGFSYSSNKRDLRHDEAGISNDLYDFLQAFFTEHPQYAKNDFYITGESYAGHYIPAFASRVHKGNKAKEGIHINLKGFAIGNGLTDPAVQYKAYTDYALDMGVIQQADYKNINKMIPYYDIRKKCEGSLCYDFSNMEKFLNQKSVRDALGVGDIEFVSCSSAVYQAMILDWMRNLEVGIPALLEDGINMLIYAGEYDLICNWLGKSCNCFQEEDDFSSIN
ncbi:hypothetical protein Syun_016319 [Stephania yunnanensis]|uniref:Carboxypeptidase n=1 Tax=Stephania yunnanensis TaxID=152371 RepID=A0AAP0P193_9MAGN